MMQVQELDQIPKYACVDFNFEYLIVYFHTGNILCLKSKTNLAERGVSKPVFLL